MKIIEVYFAAKSVLLTQRQYWKDFGRNNVPYGRTIQRLVAIFQKDRKCGRCQQRLTSFIIWHNSWEYSWFRGTPWGRNWHFENIRNILWRYQSKDWKWPWLSGFEWVEQCQPLWPLQGICYTSCLWKFGHQTLNCPSVRYIHCFFQNLSCIAGVRRTDFEAKYASMIFIDCCIINRPVGSILASKESPRPAVYTTRKMWKKSRKTQLWNEKQYRSLFLDHFANVYFTDKAKHNVRGELKVLNCKNEI